MSISIKYTISDKLLANVREITKIVCELNNKKFSHVTYSEILEKSKKRSAESFSLKPDESRNYINALEKFSKKSTDFNLNTVMLMHSVVMSNLAPKNQVGKFRNAQTKKKVKDLIKSISNSKKDVDPLILAGLFYKDFFSMDPFVHATDRVGILATRILLMDLGVNVFNLFSFEKIGEVKTRDNTKWLEYFTDCVLQEMFRVKKELEKSVYKPEKDLNKDQEKIIKHIEKHGFITDSEYSKITDRKKATRVLDFNKLIDKNLIQRCGKGRQTHYVLK